MSAPLLRRSFACPKRMIPPPPPLPHSPPISIHCPAALFAGIHPKFTGIRYFAPHCGKPADSETKNSTFKGTVLMRLRASVLTRREQFVIRRRPRPCLVTDDSKGSVNPPREAIEEGKKRGRVKKWGRGSIASRPLEF